MQATKPQVKHTRVRHPKSCAECRRRKQKCIPSKDGPCQNCLRRYPPVECIGLREVHGHWVVENLADRTSRSDKAVLQPSWSKKPATPGATASFPPLFNSGPIIGGPRVFGGILTEMTTLHGMPIESTLRIAELAHLFNQYVVPNYVSVDGQNLPLMFKIAIQPWMIQSPLMPNIAILMASYSERFERGLDLGRHSETFSIKAYVLGLVNKFLEQDFKQIGDEAIRAVTHLVITEWWWGSQKALWAHMNGIKEMVRLEGGLDKFAEPTLPHVLTLTDYELACCYERKLFLDYQPEPPPDTIQPSLVPTIMPHLSSPLYPSPSTFQQNHSLLDISIEAADILDDIRFLTLSITSPCSPPKTAKIQSTASWLNSRITSLPEPKPLPRPHSSKATIRAHLSIIIRHTALIYTSSISAATPFAKPSPTSLVHLKLIKEHIRKVDMSRWKEIPGIFQWILLVLCPSCSEAIEDRRLQKKMAVTGMAIGLEGFGLGIEYLKAFYGVQRWIAEEIEVRDRVEEEENVVTDGIGKESG